MIFIIKCCNILNNLRYSNRSLNLIVNEDKEMVEERRELIPRVSVVADENIVYMVVVNRISEDPEGVVGRAIIGNRLHLMQEGGFYDAVRVEYEGREGPNENGAFVSIYNEVA
jgi:hypothetical protein